MLFNLDDDIGERHDVAASHARIVERLLGLAEKARDDLGDAVTGQKGKNVRRAGKL